MSVPGASSGSECAHMCESRPTCIRCAHVCMWCVHWRVTLCVWCVDLCVAGGGWAQAERCTWLPWVQQLDIIWEKTSPVRPPASLLALGSILVGSLPASVQLPPWTTHWCLLAQSSQWAGSSPGDGLGTKELSSAPIKTPPHWCCSPSPFPADSHPPVPLPLQQVPPNNATPSFQPGGDMTACNFALQGPWLPGFQRTNNPG